MSDEDEDKKLVTRLGPIDIDLPRAIGFYGGIAAAVAFDLIAPPLAVFIAAVPFLKLLKRQHATMTERALAAVLEGAAKPVGGDAEAVVRPAWVDDEKEAEKAESDGRGATTEVALAIPVHGA